MNEADLYKQAGDNVRSLYTLKASGTAVFVALLGLALKEFRADPLVLATFMVVLLTFESAM